VNDNPSETEPLETEICEEMNDVLSEKLPVQAGILLREDAPVAIREYSNWRRGVRMSKGHPRQFEKQHDPCGQPHRTLQTLLPSSKP
jgi:hypothetical protein